MLSLSHAVLYSCSRKATTGTTQRKPVLWALQVSPCANVGQTTWTELQTEDEEDEDEDEDEEEDVSPLGIVFQLIEDEELSKNCSTTIEEEHVWYVMYKTLLGSYILFGCCLWFTFPVRLSVVPFYFQDGHDCVEDCGRLREE